VIKCDDLFGENANGHVRASFVPKSGVICVANVPVISFSLKDRSVKWSYIYFTILSSDPRNYH